MYRLLDGTGCAACRREGRLLVCSTHQYSSASNNKNKKNKKDSLKIALKGFYKAAPNLLQLFLSDNMSEYTKEAITTLLGVEGNASYPSWLVYLAQSDEFNDM